jgi:hypothetical protein
MKHPAKLSFTAAELLLSDAEWDALVNRSLPNLSVRVKNWLAA